MKNCLLIPSVFILLLVISCNKSNPPAAPPVGTYVSEVTSYVPKLRIEDSFGYDGDHRMTTFVQEAYDSSGPTLVVRSSGINFAFPKDTTAPPSSYTIRATGDIHDLSYDSQNRLLLDSSVSGSGYVAQYAYPTGSIAVRIRFDANPVHHQIDTFFTTGANVGAIHSYQPNSTGTADSLAISLQFFYGSSINPMYHPTLTNSIGPLLYVSEINGVGGLMDPISAQAFNSITGTGNILLLNPTVNYSPTTDPNGQVTFLTAQSGHPAAYVYFAYY